MRKITAALTRDREEFRNAVFTCETCRRLTDTIVHDSDGRRRRGRGSHESFRILAYARQVPACSHRYASGHKEAGFGFILSPATATLTSSLGR
jgi:hypothetical protein